MGSQLDALSNYHFAPRPIDQIDTDELQIQNITTAPALSIEEIIPMSVSDARQVTPEEVYQKRNSTTGSILKGETEYTKQDKKRIRQEKKAKRRVKQKQKLYNEKLLSKLSTTSSSLGYNNAYEKRKIVNELNMLKTYNKIDDSNNNENYTKSTTFF